MINGKPLIYHLSKRCLATGLPVVLSVPYSERRDFFWNTSGLKVDIDKDLVHRDNPLKRMYITAKKLGIDPIIRVCADKIFIDTPDVLNALSIFQFKKLDYLYSSKFTDGTLFEIISMSALEKAYHKFETPIEHISYAIRSVVHKSMDYDPILERSSSRFLVDYPEDLEKLEVILSTLGNDCQLHQAIDFCNKNPFVDMINELPLVTVYTSSYNSIGYVKECYLSVENQDRVKFEYIFVDDFSNDGTYGKIMSFNMSSDKKTILVRNDQNQGLAWSSNRALSMARGKYIIRLDSDDYFLNDMSLKTLIDSIGDADVVYPSFLTCSSGKAQNPKKNHHVGGALFKRSAVNHIKFNDKLRNYDGLDFWHRAKDQLKISYLNEPIFFYRQRKDSMSKTNIKERKQIKKDLDAKYNRP